MSAATSSRSSATWSRSASAWSASGSARRCRPRPSWPPRSACSTRWSAASASPTTRESFRKQLRAGELDDKEIEIEVRDTGAGMPSFEIPGMPGASIGVMNIGEMLGKAFGNRTKTRRVSVKDSHDILLDEESDKLLDNEEVVAGGDPRRSRTTASSSSTRSTRSAPATGGMRRRRQPRGRAARPPAADRGHDGRDQVRAGEDRPHPLHRLGRLPRGEAVGPAARAAGPPADPGRAAAADPGRFPPHPDRDRGEPDQAVRGADGDRGADARVHRRRHRRDRLDRGRDQRARSRTSARGACRR